MKKVRRGFKGILCLMLLGKPLYIDDNIDIYYGVSGCGPEDDPYYVKVDDEYIAFSEYARTFEFSKEDLVESSFGKIVIHYK